MLVSLPVEISPTLIQFKADRVFVVNRSVSAKSHTSQGSQPYITYHGKVKILFIPYRATEVLSGSIQYEVTTLTADQIIVCEDPAYTFKGQPIAAGSGYANGNVVIHDPLGDFTCQNLEFNYNSHTGLAHQAHLVFKGLDMDAETIVVEPNKYILYNVFAKDPSNRGMYSFRMKTITVEPGQMVEAKSVHSKIFGVDLGTYPKAVQGLDQRTLGLRYPTPGYSLSTGPSVNYSSSILVDQLRVLGGGFQLARSSFPSYSLELSSSELSPAKTTGLITPTSDLDNRFLYGYFDNIEVNNPWDEGRYLASRKDTLSAGTFINDQTNDRLKIQTFNEPFVLTFEHGGSYRGVGGIVDLHLESINLLGQNSEERGVIRGTVAPLEWSLARNLLVQSRIDTQAFVGGHAFAWVRSELGLVKLFSPHLRVGAGLELGQEFGNAQFISDRLYSRNGFFFRGDFESGPHRLSIIEKFDSQRDRFYDQEIMIAQLAGLFEPYISYRSFPEAIRIGIQIRFDSLFNQLRNRNPGRPKVENSGMTLQR